MNSSYKEENLTQIIETIHSHVCVVERDDTAVLMQRLYGTEIPKDLSDLQEATSEGEPQLGIYL